MSIHMNIRRSVVHALLFASVVFPMLAGAQGLVPCDNSLPRDANGQIIPNSTVENPCGFDQFIELIQRVLNYLIYIVAAPIAAIMFAIAGYMYLTAGEDSGKVKKAHDIFISVLWGFGIMLIAWALVSFVLNLFTGDNSGYSLLQAPAT